MTHETLQDFFFWCLMINMVIYTLTVITIFVFKDFVCKVNLNMFEMDRAQTLQTMQTYLGNYKLIMTVLNFVPWLTLYLIG